MSLHPQALFRHGVASGDPLPAAVVIWTRVTPPQGIPVEVKWAVATDAEMGDVVACGRETAEESSDFTIKVDVDGLRPSTDYYYCFEAFGSRSRVGHTKTLPSATTERVRIGVCCCAKYTSGYFNAYARMAERADLDFVVHLGDYIYEVGTIDGRAPGPMIGRVMDPPHECTSLRDYRRRYAHYRRDHDLQLFHARHALIATLDDHEISFDAWRGGSSRHDPDDVGPWNERKTAAIRAWREWLPVRASAVYPDRIYRAFPVGDLADLIVLDSRTMRDRQSGDLRVAASPKHSILGSDQLRWLQYQLGGSRAVWRLIANSTMIGQMYARSLSPGVAAQLSALNLLSSRGGPDPDAWDGYAGERARLFSWMKAHGIRDTVFLSGDVHTAWALNLTSDPADPRAVPLGVEFVTPSLTSENYDERVASSTGMAVAGVEQAVVSENPHVRWADLDGHGYVVLDVTRDSVQADWYVVAGVRHPSPHEHFEAGWRVARGEDRLRPAHGPTPGLRPARDRG